MNRLWLAALAVVISVGCATTRAAAPEKSGADLWLTCAQDDASTERRIAEYLRTKGLRVQTDNRGDDLTVTVGFESEGRPAYRIIVDTIPLSVAEDGTVQERVIKLLLATGVFVPLEAKKTVLEIANHLHARMPIGRFVVNEEDRELEMNWSLNVMGSEQPVHLETVSDAIARMLGAWQETHTFFADIL